jgi:hypothetical protein
MQNELSPLFSLSSSGSKILARETLKNHCPILFSFPGRSFLFHRQEVKIFKAKCPHKISLKKNGNSVAAI